MTVTCDPNIHIVGGDVSKSQGDNAGSVATFNCPDGYYPSPVITTRCLRSGNWSYTSRYGQPICKEFLCPPPVLEEGFYSPVNTSYAIGDVVTLQCYEGYSLRGSVSRTCKMNGRWTGANTVCNSGSQDCPHPGIPAGGSKTGTNYNIGYKVRYHCNNGLVLVGSSTRECERQNEWSGRMPTCQHKSSFDTPDDVAEAFTASLTSTLGLTRTDSAKTPESHARKIYVGKDADLHIYFLIDASNSVGQKNFDQAITVVANLIDKISSFDIKPRFGVITYASGPEVILNINDKGSNNMETVMEALQSDKAKYGAHGDRRGTNIHAALAKVYESMSFSKVSLKEKWTKIRFVTILFTDGKANMGGDPRKAVIQIEDFVNAGGKRTDYLDMYAFGITQGVELMELDGLASKKPDETHTFLVKKTKDLVEAFNKILDVTKIGDLCGVGDEVEDAEFRRKYPWHVTFIVPDSGSCSGSIVAPQWILTAAHCFTKLLDNSGISRISVSIDRYTEPIIVKSLVQHPRFNIAAKVAHNITQFYDYDVALLELETKLVFNDRIRPVCLPCTRATTRALRKSHPITRCSDHESILLPTDTAPTARFLKHNQFANTVKGTTIHIQTPEVSRAACEENALRATEYRHVQTLDDVVTDRMLCSGSGEREEVTCKGESGGSVFMFRKRRYIQVGVVSWGVINVCEAPDDDHSFARDFHTNLFKVQPFLRFWLGKILVFID